LTIIVHLAVARWRFDFSWLNGNISVHLVKINDPGFLGERTCTAVVDNCYHA